MLAKRLMLGSAIAVLAFASPTSEADAFLGSVKKKRSRAKNKRSRGSLKTKGKVRQSWARGLSKAKEIGRNLLKRGRKVPGDARSRHSNRGRTSKSSRRHNSFKTWGYTFKRMKKYRRARTVVPPKHALHKGYVLEAGKPSPGGGVLVPQGFVMNRQAEKFSEDCRELLRRHDSKPKEKFRGSGLVKTGGVVPGQYHLSVENCSRTFRGPMTRLHR